MPTTVLEQRLSLLITDDDHGFRETLRGIFEPAGFRTYLAESGEEAIDIVRGYTIHLALLDQNLPRMTGLQTLRLIRQINLLLPVILVTADATNELRVEAQTERAFSVLPKPFTRHDLVQVVHRALSVSYPGHSPLQS
jgi:CheY-like chemotaxis protein